MLPFLTRLGHTRSAASGEPPNRTPLERGPQTPRRAKTKQALNSRSPPLPMFLGRPPRREGAYLFVPAATTFFRKPTTRPSRPAPPHPTCSTYAVFAKSPWLRGESEVNHLWPFRRRLAGLVSQKRPQQKQQKQQQKQRQQLLQRLSPVAAVPYVAAAASALSPIYPLLGGIAMGLSVAANALVFGRVTGVSGHINRVLRGERLADAFLLLGIALGGLLFSPWLPSTPAAILPFMHVRLFVAGALVAIGASLANGCTSGHAICGMARFSPRSLVAVPVFFAVAMAVGQFTGTAGLLMHAVSNAPPGGALALSAASPTRLAAPYALVLSLQGIGVMILQKSRNEALRRWASVALQILIGVSFSMGLVWSGMAVPLKVASFFDVGRASWDPSLMFVFPGALFCSAIAFRTVQSGKSSLLVPEKHSIPRNSPVSVTLVLGAVIFGFGWGLVGLCPGPALVLVGASLRSWNALFPSILSWFGGYAVGLTSLSTVKGLVRNWQNTN
jgi:uncharacterized protein